MDFPDILQIIYITPGFIALEFYYFLIPVKRRRDSETIIWSLVLSVPIIGLVYFLQNLTGRPCFDYLPNYVLISWITALLSGLFFAFLYRLKVINYVSSKVFRVNIEYPRVWNKLFTENRKAFFRFSLNDGRVYIGKVEHFSINPNTEERGVLIRPSIIIDDENEVIGSFERGTYIEGEDIISIDILESLDIKYEGRLKD